MATPRDDDQDDPELRRAKCLDVCAAHGAMNPTCLSSYPRFRQIFNVAAE
jgi:hypothetical protein